MNRIAKILSAIVSVTVALSIAVVMLTSALAAAAPTLSLNLASESGNKVVLEVKLDNGAFGSVDFGVNYNDAKVVKCENIGINIDIAMAGGVQATNPATGLYSAAIATGYDKEGGVVATYTFQVVDGAEITKDDFSLVVSNCTSVDNEALTATVVNKLPAAAPSTEPSTEATEPSTEATEPSTEATEPSTEATEPSTEATEPSTEATEPSTEATEPSTEATEPSTEATEPSTEATEPSTEATEPSTEATEPSTEATEPSTEATEPSTEATEPSTEATEPSTEATEPSTEATEAPTEAPTEKPVDGEVVNPDTGDSVTATAAIFSLLAVSGAAIVALRKKED